MWGWAYFSDTPRTTATTDVSGDFTAAFSADLGPHEFARVEVKSGDAHIVNYAYDQDVFTVDTFNYISGYTSPYQSVTVTVYDGAGPAVRGAQTVTANWPHGDFTAEAPVQPGDTVEVDYGGGVVRSMVTGPLTARADLALDQVTGQALPLQTVRVFVYNWMWGDYAETSTVADASGNYTATFSSYDLTARDAVYPAYAAGGGSEVLLSYFLPRIQTFVDQNRVIGNGDAPSTPYTFTLTHDGSDYVLTGVTDLLNSTTWADFGALGVDIVGGDLVSLETPTWSGSMVVADLSLTADTANDRYTGSADQPGEITVVSFPWQNWSSPVRPFYSGAAPASSSFAIDMPGHDVRAAVYGRLIHNDANDNVTRLNFEVRFIEVYPPWGVSSPQYSETEGLTATLFASDQVTD